MTSPSQAPPDTTLPPDGNPLADYIYRRLMDSFMTPSAIQFVSWTLHADHGTWFLRGRLQPERALARLLPAELQPGHAASGALPHPGRRRRSVASRPPVPARGRCTLADVFESSEIQGVWLVRVRPVADDRGRFLETYRASWLPFAKPMVQANRSDSAARVLRGLHYHRRQADLWFVQSGRVTVVLVDTRVASPTEGKHTSLQLGGGEDLALYIPEGIAHGFYAHDEVTMTYLVTNEYDGSDELGISWNDPDLGIDWPDPEPILSGRDRQNPRLADIPADRRVPYTG